ncbi:hypothetical protein [Cedecea colo]|uniref:Uncharacterized protein n=1 Tax=Cedecea colo TaxID=2552946 RepID=A0ABX0VJT4_9ENTR|nr:hypothetical protein [Cedecea colo]NIY47319.1 hypothetical protein [Cedecea colo]
MTVKIYSIPSEMLSPPVIGDSFVTDLVLHTDYAALKAKMDMVHGLMEAAEQANALVREGVENLTKKRDALAVCNSRKDEIIGRLVSKLNLSGYEARQNSVNPAEALLFDALQVYLEPATDAALAEVRNEAQIEICESLIEIFRRCSDPGKPFSEGAAGALAIIDMKLEELRKESV